MLYDDYAFLRSPDCVTGMDKYAFLEYGDRLVTTVVRRLTQVITTSKTS